jgi:uncharacterized protein YciI
MKLYSFFINLELISVYNPSIRITMQFLLLAYDGNDSGATDRRQGVRQEHLDKISLLKKRGEFLFGGAILNDEGKMIGSMVLYEFPDRAALDHGLKDEPYITENVWQKIEIRPFRLAKIE